jgi:RNA polymerase sigma-70 factor (ECF subfamily)
MISEANRQEVLAALAELPDAYRDVMVLREMENLSYADISEITGVPIGTVMSRLSRGRAELKKAILRQRAGDEQDAV